MSLTEPITAAYTHGNKMFRIMFIGPCRPTPLDGDNGIYIKKILRW